ncbi:NCS2 family permease [Peribacillus faecalis]|uniref:NCS2 family permease n=1 Tax=Peribacillus faecalis TaxID=2772559 RepID=UPI002E27F2BD|nr:NCS2 family permease [Peribacillus faecalis]
MLNQFFNIQKHGSTVKTEVVAGLTTFFTMVYIVIVNPAILSSVGVPFDQVFMATIFAAVVGTLIMGLGAKYPIAIAPGMGLNAYFASIVATQGISYQTVFGAVFIAGIIFLLISVSRIREMLLHAIPDTVKYGISSGIGLFIAFLGLKNAGIIVGNESNLIALGDLTNPVTLLSIVGLLITLVLMIRGVKGGLFIGMIITAIIGYFCGMLHFDGVVSMPPTPTFFDLDFGGIVSNGLYAVIFSFLLVTIFDTTGTMMAVSEQAGLVKDGKFPRAKQAFLGDSVATIVGAAFGTSPSTAYVESSTGVAAGGRTGLTAVVVGILFLLTMFFSPIVGAIASLSSITAPVMIIVGSLMMGGLTKIKWSSFEDAFTAFIIILIMPLAGSISTGIAFGFIIYPFTKLIAGKGKEVNVLIYIFAVLFLIQLIFFPAH